jgi:hypothetical protein
MNRSLLSSIAIAALITASTSAFAADFGMDTEEAPSGNFEGPYLGIFSTTYLGVAQYGGGVELGYNFLPSESFLLGLEVSGAIYPTGYDPELWLKGKAGFTVDNFAVYGFGEVGAYFPAGAPVQQYGLGAGAEAFVTDALSVAAEVGMRADIGDPLANPHAQVGLRFHF